MLARHKRGNLLVHVLGQVARVRVIAQELCAALAVFGLDGFEKLRHAMWIVAGIVENTHPEQIRFLLGSARHLQKAESRCQSNALLRDLPYCAAEQHARGKLPESGDKAHFLLLCRVAYRVLKNHVRELVCRYASQLSCARGRLNGAEVDENDPAR